MSEAERDALSESAESLEKEAEEDDLTSPPSKSFLLNSKILPASILFDKGVIRRTYERR